MGGGVKVALGFSNGFFVSENGKPAKSNGSASSLFEGAFL